eukprot:CAMPEP_0170643728 /NCGR_PEP_ID=MMETSP0224-20130122/42057_1 /TAXON_ID=285029 /ORGANISM="Togula jolla, Strain CCCM 725" /LENGTH=41 /DNA_ID= /DNA_START= /DNA_END= /DNA_ORIENTATION=
MNSCVKGQASRQVFGLFDEMRRRRLEPGTYAYGAAIGACRV